MQDLEDLITGPGVSRVEDCDDKHVRYSVRESFTMCVPRNKQNAVRTAVYKTLLAIVPPSTQSQLMSSDRGSGTKPLGWEYKCEELD